MIHRALSLLAVDPTGLGGAVVQGGAGMVRAALLEEFSDRFSPDAPRRRLPLNISEDRLHGGLDLTLTLAEGRPARLPGVLTEAAGGILTLPLAERASISLVAALIGMMDGPPHSRATVLALDEHIDGEPGVATALQERLAFVVSSDAKNENDSEDLASVEAVVLARRCLASVELTVAQIEALCHAALALGVGSCRGELFAARAACASAALAGRTIVDESDLTLAAALVLAPRATRIPAAEDAAPPPPPPPPDQAETTDAAAKSEPQELEERVLEAAVATLPPSLLTMVPTRRNSSGAGRTGATAPHRARGRRIGSRPGGLLDGARLDLVETLRAAAPWQPVRPRSSARLAIRKSDFRIQRRVHHSGATIVFVVDASGSSALHRLAEAKGAVELLLAESYVRRDRVALIGFRGTKAELVLPPTRSLVRARRTLAGLPGGGGTPLASAFVEALRAASEIERERTGGAALIVFLTDARANIALDGSGGRPAAERDARDAARRLLFASASVLFIDTSPRPSPFAAELAGLMGANYLPLPIADARNVAGVVRGMTSALERSA
jgi:magnesium chelatase subunit D